eukprot:COSAG02_NODE_1113_length_14503_cov_87.812205_10_plen_93_part_00
MKPASSDSSVSMMKKLNATMEALPGKLAALASTATASRAAVMVVTRQVGTGLQLYRITGVQRKCPFLFPLGNDMPFPSFPPSGNEGNRNGGA